MGSRTRREFLQISGIGGVVFASGLLEACSRLGSRPDPGLGMADDFYFVQLSDTHWGYKGPANPEATVELPRAVELVNALPQAPDFVVFTGDLTHTTDDDQERRRRMAQVREHLARLRVPTLRLMAGEHDASLAAEARAAALGSRPPRKRPGAARRRHRPPAAGVPAARDPAGRGELMRFAGLLLALLAAADNPGERVVHMVARRFTYLPDVIELQLGIPVIIELTSADRDHGFSVPDLGIRIDVEPGKTARVRVVPDKLGAFDFHCDVFCGSGHEEMAGRIVVSAPAAIGGNRGH